MKFGKRQLVFLAFLLIATIAIAGLTYTESKPVTRYEFQGVELSFRDDLRLAKNISVYPDEKTILDMIWDPEIQNITIAFVDSSDNQLTAVNAFEITYKLNVAYNQFGWVVNFNGEEVESFTDLSGSVENIVIALVPPSLAADTGVELNSHTVYIKGKTQKDFDLATIKFLMSALNITV